MLLIYVWSLMITVCADVCLWWKSTWFINRTKERVQMCVTDLGSTFDIQLMMLFIWKNLYRRMNHSYIFTHSSKWYALHGCCQGWMRESHGGYSCPIILMFWVYKYFWTPSRFFERRRCLSQRKYGIERSNHGVAMGTGEYRAVWRRSE